MRRKSLLIAAAGKMMKQNQWQQKYDPYNQFNIIPYDYNTEQQYLRELRQAWKWEEDPGDEYGKYVNVNKYNNYEDYKDDIEKCIEQQEWYEEYDPFEVFNAIPFKYSTKKAYLHALRREWKQALDPYNKYSHIDVNMYYDFSSYEDAIMECDD